MAKVINGWRRATARDVRVGNMLRIHFTDGTVFTGRVTRHWRGWDSSLTRPVGKYGMYRLAPGGPGSAQWQHDGIDHVDTKA